MAMQQTPQATGGAVQPSQLRCFAPTTKWFFAGWRAAGLPRLPAEGHIPKAGKAIFYESADNISARLAMDRDADFIDSVLLVLPKENFGPSCARLLRALTGESSTTEPGEFRFLPEPMQILLKRTEAVGSPTASQFAIRAVELSVEGEQIATVKEDLLPPNGPVRELSILNMLYKDAMGLGLTFRTEPRCAPDQRGGSPGSVPQTTQLPTLAGADPCLAASSATGGGQSPIQTAQKLLAEKGDSVASAGKAGEAARILEESVGASPRCGEVWTLLAYARYRNAYAPCGEGSYDGAEQAAQRGLELAADADTKAAALRNMGRVAAAQGHWQEAAQKLRASLDVVGANRDAQTWLEDVLLVSEGVRPAVVAAVAKVMGEELLEDADLSDLSKAELRWIVNAPLARAGRLLNRAAQDWFFFCDGSPLQERATLKPGAKARLSAADQANAQLAKRLMPAAQPMLLQSQRPTQRAAMVPAAGAPIVAPVPTVTDSSAPLVADRTLLGITENGLIKRLGSPTRRGTAPPDKKGRRTVNVHWGPTTGVGDSYEREVFAIGVVDAWLYDGRVVSYKAYLGGYNTYDAANFSNIKTMNEVAPWALAAKPKRVGTCFDYLVGFRVARFTMAFPDAVVSVCAMVDYPEFARDPSSGQMKETRVRPQFDGDIKVLWMGVHDPSWQ